MDSKSEPKKRKKLFAFGFELYKSVSEKEIHNPLILNKGFIKPTLSGTVYNISISKLGTEVDTTYTNLVMSRDVLERHNRFMDSLKETKSNNTITTSDSTHYEENKRSKEDLVTIMRNYPPNSEQFHRKPNNDTTKEESIMVNESFTIKEEDKYNYIVSYLTGRNFKSELSDIYKMSATYRKFPCVVQRIHELSQYSNKLSRNLNRYENSR